MTISKEDWSPTIFYFTIHFPMLLSEKHATYHTFESTNAKATITFSRKFPNTITLWFQFYLSYCFYMFSWCFKAQVLQEHQWVFSCYLVPWNIYLVNFSFQVHRSKLKNFQTHNRNHPNELLFENSHLLQFSQYFLWVYVI